MNNVKFNKAIVFFDRQMAFSFYALIYFLPISNALVEIFSALTLLGFLIKRSLILTGKLLDKQESDSNSFVRFFRLFGKAFALPSNPLNKPVAVWILICAVSILISTQPSLSFKAFMGKTLQSAFLFFNFLEAIRTRKRLMIYMMVFGVSCFFISLSGLNQYIFKMDFIRMNAIEHARVNSTFRAPNDFAAYLVLLIPILISVLLAYKHLPVMKFKKSLGAFLGVTLLLAAFNLLVTYSRGAILALSAAFIVFAVFNFRQFIKIALMGLLFIPAFLYKLATERVYMSWENIFHGFGRSEYWAEAINMIKAKPLVGFGLNTYSVAARDFKISWGGYPHNCYLHMTAELGFIGLASFLWILCSLYYVFARTFRLLGDPLRKALALGVMTGLTGFFIHIAFDTFLYSTQLGSLFWLHMALLLALLNEEGGLVKAYEGK